METDNINKNLINIILTGATGFLGSHLLGKMLLDGYHVTAVKRNSSELVVNKQSFEDVSLNDV